MLLNECLDPLGATQSVIAIKENDYFQAARAVGSPAARILWRHVLAERHAAHHHHLLDYHQSLDSIHHL